MAAYQQVTLATLRARLRDRTETVPFWSAPEATAALNEALKIWNLCTGQWRDLLTYVTTPGDEYLALPSPLLWPARVTWNGAPVTKSSQDDLNAAKPGWQAHTTATGGAVPTKVSVWVPVSLGLIAIWPKDASGVGSLVVDGIAATPVLAADGDFIDLSNDQLAAILDYGLHYLAFKSPEWAATLPLRKRFFEKAGDQNALFRASQLYRTAMSGDPQEKRRPPRVPNTPPPIPETP